MSVTATKPHAKAARPALEGPAAFDHHVKMLAIAAIIALLLDIGLCSLLSRLPSWVGWTVSLSIIGMVALKVIMMVRDEKRGK